MQSTPPPRQDRGIWVAVTTAVVLCLLVGLFALTTVVASWHGLDVIVFLAVIAVLACLAMGAVAHTHRSRARAVADGTDRRSDRIGATDNERSEVV